MAYNQYESLLDQYFTGYMVNYDAESDGLFLTDNHGNILGAEETAKLISGLVKYHNSNSREKVTKNNIENYKKSIIRQGYFDQLKEKKGTIFMYQETGTNHYRIGFTQNFNNRIKNIESTSPVDIKVTAKHGTINGNLLKEFLIKKFEKKHSYSNWYVFDDNDIRYFKDKEYIHEFEEYIYKKRSQVRQQITCAKCGETLTNLNRNIYYYCGLCSQRFCSQECAETSRHMKIHIMDEGLMDLKI